MSQNKTIANSGSVDKFIQSIENEQKRNDCLALLEMMHNITKEPATMWGDTIVGFGNYHYKYDSGREGDMFLTGFSPRKQNMTVYFMVGFDDFTEELKQIGKCKSSKSCLYFKKLDDLKLDVFHDMVEKSVQATKDKWH